MRGGRVDQPPPCDQPSERARPAGTGRLPGSTLPPEPHPPPEHRHPPSPRRPLPLRRRTPHLHRADAGEGGTCPGAGRAAAAPGQRGERASEADLVPESGRGGAQARGVVAEPARGGGEGAAAASLPAAVRRQLPRLPVCRSHRRPLPARRRSRASRGADHRHRQGHRPLRDAHGRRARPGGVAAARPLRVRQHALPAGGRRTDGPAVDPAYPGPGGGRLPPVHVRFHGAAARSGHHAREPPRQSEGDPGGARHEAGRPDRGLAAAAPRHGPRRPVAAPAVAGRHLGDAARRDVRPAPRALAGGGRPAPDHRQRRPGLRVRPVPAPRHGRAARGTRPLRLADGRLRRGTRPPGDPERLRGPFRTGGPAPRRAHRLLRPRGGHPPGVGKRPRREHGTHRRRRVPGTPPVARPPPRPPGPHPAVLRPRDRLRAEDRRP